MGKRPEHVCTAASRPMVSMYNRDPLKTQRLLDALETLRISLTIKKLPSHTNRPTLPSSPTATSQTISPGRRSFITPARLSCASHSKTLLSDSQSPSGDGTNTRRRGALRNLKSGDRKVVPRLGDATFAVDPAMWLATAE